MLSLTRCVGQRIVVGKDVVIELVEVRGANQARIGVTAPRDVPIFREELLSEEERAKLPPAGGKGGQP